MREHSDSDDAGLWDFARRVYGADGVASRAIELQDRQGVDVNLLLCALWCASRQRLLDPPRLQRLDAACAPWREQVIKPLREQRRVWRDLPERAAEYRDLLDLELAAERRQLEHLAAACADLPGTGAVSLTSALFSLSAFYALPGAALDPLRECLEPVLDLR